MSQDMPYPTKKVLGLFLLSPVFPSTLIWLAASIISFKSVSVEALGNSLLTLLVFNLFGVVVGIVPALLTGLLAIYFKMYRTVMNVSILTLIGFIFTINAVKFMAGHSDSGYGFIGALCAFCVSIIALPKKELALNAVTHVTK
jgi:MFS-type transporter involved in bile tolerance (Atg22 family)